MKNNKDVIKNNEDKIEEEYEFTMCKSAEFTREYMDSKLVNNLAIEWGFDIDKLTKNESERFDERLFNYNNRRAAKKNIHDKFPFLVDTMEFLVYAIGDGIGF